MKDTCTALITRHVTLPVISLNLLSGRQSSDDCESVSGRTRYLDYSLISFVIPGPKDAPTQGGVLADCQQGG